MPVIPALMDTEAVEFQIQAPLEQCSDLLRHQLNIKKKKKVRDIAQ